MEELDNTTGEEVPTQPAADNNGVDALSEQLASEATLAPESEEPASAATTEPLDLGFTTSASSGGPPQSSSAESQKILAEIRDKATKEKEQFYAEREKKIEAKKKQALEEQSMTGETAVVSGWEGVVNLIELDPSKSEGKDLSKMRQLLITLKHKGN